MRHVHLIALALLATTPATARPAPSPTAPLARAIARFAPPAPGHLGVAAIDLESGVTLAIEGDKSFPMASAVKVAVAATFLYQVEQRRHSLTEMFTLDETMRARSEGITETLPHAGVALSAANLLELMLTVSDNTAADMLIQAVGGPQAVTDWLKASGIEGQRADRGIARLILDDGNKPMTPGLTEAQSLARFEPVEPWKTDTEIWPPNPAFDSDPRDSSTPLAMATLLAKLYQGQLLSPDHTRLLFEIMARCKTGKPRVIALLPPGTPWAHKTGTLAGISNDVGVLTLPNGHHLVLALFEYGVADAAARSRTLADVGRLLFDGFLMMPETK
ncbi:serine hydrolase [Sphingomonas sp. BIUV-7]|uniref:beta-lactamase n=1 Tax=Sphingomonas natans TaxID=3063330 RepID=A0ABT8Y567_9SPHN|nr:serine hydrolase [Sphingomonas sp. BIUV-7]MDO6413142.1 serine hydrolase [Sphingomonas sp. BIUV-7]